MILLSWCLLGITHRNQVNAKWLASEFHVEGNLLGITFKLWLFDIFHKYLNTWLAKCDKGSIEPLLWYICFFANFFVSELVLVVVKGEYGSLEDVGNKLIFSFGEGQQQLNLSELVHPLQNAVCMFVFVELEKVFLASKQLFGKDTSWLLLYGPASVCQNFHRNLDFFGIVPIGIEFFVLGLHFLA